MGFKSKRKRNYGESVCIAGICDDDHRRAGICDNNFAEYRREKEKLEQVSQDSGIGIFGVVILVWHVFDRLYGLCRRTIDLSVAGVGSVRAGACDHAAGGDNGKADP